MLEAHHLLRASQSWDSHNSPLSSGFRLLGFILGGRGIALSPGDFSPAPSSPQCEPYPRLTILPGAPTSAGLGSLPLADGSLSVRLSLGDLLNVLVNSQVISQGGCGEVVICLWALAHGLVPL